MPSLPSHPDSSSPGPERKERAAIKSWGQNTGKELGTEYRDSCVFGFPHVFSRPPPPHLPSVGLLPPPGPGPEEGVNQDLSLRKPPPRLAPTETGADPGGPTPRRIPLRRRERGSPGQGWAGGRDAQGARKRGRRAQSRERGPSIAPPNNRPASLEERGSRSPPSSTSLHRHPIPRRGTHLQRPSRPGGQQDQCQGGQHCDPARGTERAAVRGGSAAPVLCLCRRRRRRLRWPRALLLRVLALLPLPRKLTERRRGGGARSPASQLIRPTPLGTRERPLAEPPGSCARSAGRGPRPARRPQVRLPRLPCLPRTRLPGPPTARAPEQ